MKKIVDGVEVEVEDTNDKGTGEKPEEKLFTQSDVNRLISKDKKTLQAKLDALQGEFTTLQTSVLEKEQAEEKKQKEIVTGMKEGLPANILKLLDKLPVNEQFEYLTDKENVITVDKKNIPETPREKGDGLKQPKSLGQIF